MVHEEDMLVAQGAKEMGNGLPLELSSESPSDHLSSALAEQLVIEALVWASLHGFVVVGDSSPQSPGVITGLNLVHAPFSLLPSPFPEKYYRQAIEVAPLFNELVDRVSLDGDFLQRTLSRTKEVDEFTGKLLEIHAVVLQEGINQDARLGLHRSDYMLDTATQKLLQVELNTISCSFSGLGNLVSQLHRYLISCTKGCVSLMEENVPENKVLDGFAEALALAFKEYGDSSAVVLVVVQPEERNMYDQHWLSFSLQHKYGISSIRKTLGDLHAQAIISEDGSLIVGGKSVAVVYYRAGYTPRDYPSEEEWHARMTVEKSKAIKCPTISYHLAGTKKVQQELAKPGVVERFLNDPEASKKLRECFAGLWDLEGDESQAIIKEATENPHAFVLKPQREGGGNNIYGEDIKQTIMQLKEKDGGGLAAFVLMQRLFPVVHNNYFVRHGKFSLQPSVSELGIFAAYFRKGDNVIMNKQSGYLLRTKASTSNEGGVAAGFAVLDSLYLV